MKDLFKQLMKGFDEHLQDILFKGFPSFKKRSLFYKVFIEDSF